MCVGQDLEHSVVQVGTKEILQGCVWYLSVLPIDVEVMVDASNQICVNIFCFEVGKLLTPCFGRLLIAVSGGRSATSCLFIPLSFNSSAMARKESRSSW